MSRPLVALKKAVTVTMMMKALTLLLTLTFLLSSVLALAKKVSDEPERPNIPVDYTIDMVQFVVGDKNTTNFGKEW